LRHIEANGGTELLQALLAAAKALENKTGEIFLITDGQVLGTSDIIQQLAKAEVRVPCLGIGSASQDRFLALLTRSNGGVSGFLTPDERVDNALDQLFAATGGALAEQLHLASGAFRPKVDSVFSKMPLTPPPHPRRIPQRQNRRHTRILSQGLWITNPYRHREEPLSEPRLARSGSSQDAEAAVRLNPTIQRHRSFLIIGFVFSLLRIAARFLRCAKQRAPAEFAPQKTPFLRLLPAPGFVFSPRLAFPDNQAIQRLIPNPHLFIRAQRHR
jgi:hypothetical protein